MSPNPKTRLACACVTPPGPGRGASRAFGTPPAGLALPAPDPMKRPHAPVQRSPEAEERAPAPAPKPQDAPHACLWPDAPSPGAAGPDLGSLAALVSPEALYACPALARLLAPRMGSAFALELEARLRRYIEGTRKPLRPPKAQRPQCPAIGATGERCRARCWWPKGVESPHRYCYAHLGLLDAAEPPWAPVPFPVEGGKGRP
jgi:hypothetical protein